MKTVESVFFLLKRTNKHKGLNISTQTDQNTLQYRERNISKYIVRFYRGIFNSPFSFFLSLSLSLSLPLSLSLSLSLSLFHVVKTLCSCIKAWSKLTFFEKFIKYLTKTFDTCGNRDQYFVFYLAGRILFHKQNTETYQLLVMVAIAFTEEYCGHTTASLQAIWLRQIAINLYVDITCVRVMNANHDRHCSKPQIEMISQPCRDPQTLYTSRSD